MLSPCLVSLLQEGRGINNYAMNKRIKTNGPCYDEQLAEKFGFDCVHRDVYGARRIVIFSCTDQN